MMHPIRSRKPLTQKQIAVFTKLYAFAAFVLLPALAQAYMGESVVTWARNFIVGPLAVLMIIITIGAALIKPEAAKQAGYVTLVAVVLFLVMSQAGAIIGALQSSGQ